MYIIVWGVFMINKINGVSTIQNQYSVAFRNEETVTKPVDINQDADLKGIEALAVYNAPLLKNPEKLDIEPLVPTLIMPEDFENIEGEKIYTSEGKLHSIVQEDENTKTVLKPAEENEKMISLIITTDKKTGKVINEQKNFIKDDKYDEIYINEYSPETGKEIADTCYIDGKPRNASKTVYKPNNEMVIVNKNFEDNEFSVSKYSKKPDESIYVIFDKNKQLKAASEYKKSDLKQSGIDVDFYNGGMIAIRRYEEVTVPNNFGADKLNNSDLVPAESYKLDFDAKGLDGAKTHYSNGAIETNSFERNGEKVKAYFEPDGSLSRLELADRTISFDGDNQAIKENIEDNKVKITNLYDDGAKAVRVEKDKEFKEASFGKNGKPDSYSEGIIEDDGEDDSTLSLYFNKTGMLEAAYDC